MNDDLIKRDTYSSVIFSELTELMDLAESSAEKVDELARYHERYGISSWASLGVSFFSILLSAIILIKMKLYLAFQTGFNYNPYSAASLFAAIIFGAITLYFALTRRRLYQRIQRSLYTELEIHHRIMSLIDQQRKRLEATGQISPVTLATIDIRTMRMLRNAHL